LSERSHPYVSASQCGVSKFATSRKFLYDRTTKITARATLSQPVVTSFPITDDAPVIAAVIFFRGD